MEWYGEAERVFMRNKVKTMKLFLIRLGKTIRTFYSFWAIVFHIFYFFGILPNTRPIALFVLIASQCMNFIYPNYRKLYKPRSYDYYIFEFVFHILPILVVPFSLSNSSVLLFAWTILLYMMCHNTNIILYYKNSRKTLNQIRHSK